MINFILTFLLLMTSSVYADTKLAALPNNSSPTGTDETYDVPSGGSSHNVTLAQLLAYMFTPNVGIGSANPGQTLDVTGTVRSGYFISTAISASTPVVTNSGNQLVSATNLQDLAYCQSNGTNCPASDWAYQGGAGNVGVNTTTAGVGIGTIRGNGQLVIFGGNVGIATENPVQPLEVNGQAQIDNTLTTKGISNGTNGISNSQGYTQSGSSTNAFTGAVQFGSSAQGTMDINANLNTSGKGQFGGGTGSSSEFAVQGNASFGTFYSGNAPSNGIAVSGNVGIGTAAAPNNLYVAGSTVIQGNTGIGLGSPGQALDVTGTVRTQYFTISGTGPASGYVLTASDTSGHAGWSPASGGTSGWTVTNTNDVFETLAGNVGIGTTKTSSGAALSVMNGNVGIGTWIPGGSFVVQGGNVGIGTTPGDLMDVNGTVRITGTIGNIIGTNGGNVNNTEITCGNSAAAGTAVGTGTTPSFTYPTAGKIISATISGSLSAGNCSVVVDVWKANAALPTVSNTITATNYPTLSSATYATQSVSSWTTSIAANDVIMCNVRSNTCDNWNLVLGVAS